MLIGLAAKNAILIVEFAKDEYEQGKPLVDAALAGARLRLRPILMTSFAFILGNVPLWTASGSGAVARQIIGTTVIGGMLAASAFGIFLIPPIFYLVEKWSGPPGKSLWPHNRAISQENPLRRRVTEMNQPPRTEEERRKVPSINNRFIASFWRRVFSPGARSDPITISPCAGSNSLSWRER